MEAMEREGRLYFPKDKIHRIQRKRFLDELPGETVDSLWDDIAPINSQAQGVSAILRKSRSPYSSELSAPQRILAMWCSIRSADAARPFTRRKNSIDNG